jgi:hypothetical protein
LTYTILTRLTIYTYKPCSPAAGVPASKLILSPFAGQDRVIPLPTEAAQSAKASNDILRFFKEGVTSLKVDFKDVQASSEDETLLRVSGAH